jgi:DNA-binding MarR family transcriptional regulator
LISRTTEKKTKLIEELQREVRAAQSAVAAVDQAAAERLGVNSTDHRCLDILSQRGPQPASELADALGLSRSAVTAVLDRLEGRRYVRRVPNPEDRRQVVVTLTPLLYRRAREIYGTGEEEAAALERYTASELRLLRDFVRSDRQLNERRAARLVGRRSRRRSEPGTTGPGGS